MTWVRGFCRAVALAAGAIRQLDLLELQRRQRHVVDLARAVDPEEGRRRAGALSAHHGDVGVSRARMHGEIGDGDFARAGAEQGGELFIERVEALGAGGAAVGLRAEVEREDRRALVVGGEERAVRTEGQRSNGRQRRALAGLRNSAGRRRSPGRHDEERDQEPEFRLSNA